MALPEHVKKQAMDAVNHKETTAQIRMYRNNDAADTTSSSAQKNAPASRGQGGVEQSTRTPIPEHVKMQAMDAVGHKETTGQIRLVKENGSPTPPAGPARDTDRTGEKIAQMQRSGHSADAVHAQVTKDAFGGGRE